MEESNSLLKMGVNSFKANFRKVTMIIALLVIWVIFNILTSGIFITSRNLSNLFLQCAATAIVATGMVLVMVAGHIDLSAGSFVGFIGAIAAVLMTQKGFGTIPAIIVVLIIGVLLGVFQGFWVAYGEVPAFIVTLAGQLIFRGGVLGVTGGNSVGPMNDSFRAIGQDYIPRFSKSSTINDSSILIAIIFIIAFVVFDYYKRKKRIAYNFKVLPTKWYIVKTIAFCAVIALVFSIMISYQGIPYAILLVMAIVIILTVVAEKSTFGRHVYAIGGNKEAAKFSGVNIKKVNLKIFVLMGFLCAVAGIVYAARLNAATGSAGTNLEFDAITACVIGGTSTLGGEGTIYGCIIGALVMGSLDNGMSLMNADPIWQYVIKGFVLLLVVWIDVATRKKQ